MESNDPRSVFADILGTIPERHHEQFLRLVETGEASDEFRSYMDNDQRLLQAIDKAFDVQALRMHDATKSLREELEASPAGWTHAVKQLVSGIAAVTRLAQPDRKAAIAEVQEGIQATQLGKTEVREVLESLKR